jgi:hypothetical protein
MDIPFANHQCCGSYRGLNVKNGAGNYGPAVGGGDDKWIAIIPDVGKDFAGTEFDKTA